jgi:hypothetical protein
VSAAFALAASSPGRTRLVTRVRFAVRPTPLALVWAAAMDAGDFVMFRQMMLGIRERAEVAERSRPGTAPVCDLAPGRPLEYDIACVIRRAPADVYDVLAHKERYALEPGSPVEADDSPTSSSPCRKERGCGNASRCDCAGRCGCSRPSSTELSGHV